MRRRWMSAILALTMALALTACGGDSSSYSSNDSTPAETTPAAPAVEIPPVEDLTGTDTSTIPGLEDGVLTVGMECAYAPYNWTQMDDSNGAVPISNVPGAYANGYDVMIAQRICETYGWELEIVSSAWDSLCPAVQSGTMDANIAGQSMTADRMNEVDMAGPYYYATIVVLTTTENSRRQLAIPWGVQPLLYGSVDSTDRLFGLCVDTARKEGIIQTGDNVVITAGVPLSVRGTTNLVKIQVVGEPV